MPDISKITLPSGVTYNIKDEVARQTAAGGIQLRGVTTTALTDEATTNPIKIGGSDYTAVNQDAVFYGKKEFIFDGTKWHEFGDMSGLGALATKDTASASYKPAGTVSKPTFSGTEGNLSVSGTPAGTISKGNGTANYTPEGSVSTPTITVTPDTVSKYVAGSATGGGAVTAGKAASCTLPVLTTSVANEVLTIGWTAGSFTANKPTAVTMPTFTAQTIATGIKSATSTQPSFTGTGAELKFTGSSMTSTGKFTPAGSVTQPTFDGTQATITVS
jgi:hypothetical protein